MNENNELQWNDRFKTGIKKFDIQHHGLFDRYNRIVEDINNNEDNDVIKQHLNYLYVYTINHFVDEEEAMAKVGCRYLEEQRAEHRQLKEQVEKYMEKINEESFPYLELLDFLKHWLSHHIMEMDMKYTECLDKDI